MKQIVVNSDFNTKKRVRSKEEQEMYDKRIRQLKEANGE